jgi:8-oxo-dGTP diphosphatase
VSDGEVRAAGGVLLRDGADGRAEVLLVHRPRYDDWSLPKGKAEPGESFEDCAVREVHEETGIVAVLEEPLADVRYQDRKGRPKLVKYWRMQPVSGVAGFVPNDEVDELAWLPIPDAAEKLTYEHDRDLVTALGAI